MRFVTMPERTRIRALRADGLSFRAISGIVGLPQETCRRHCKAVTRCNEPSPSSVDRAMRIERLFASCNRALAEVRA